MFKNYVKVAVRTLLRSRSYSFINIFGLALGIASCALIFLYVQDEQAFDRFHENADDIYRLRVERFSSGGEAEYTATSSAPMMPAAATDIPQIKAATRLRQRTYLVGRDSRSFYEDQLFYADSSFFSVFSFNLVRGDRNRSLVAPYTAVLTESTAEKYFGATDPIGQTLDVEEYTVTVSGVVQDPPTQSHFDFDMLVSFTTAEAEEGRPSDTWGWWNLEFYTYFLLQPGSDVEAVGDLVREMPSRYIGDQESVSGYRQFLYLQPLTDIHLNSAYQYELGANSRQIYVLVFSIIAVFVLLLACINFMNLATARSAKRAKEVGMRKVSGAGRQQLIVQFLGESVLLTQIAVVVALGLMLFLLPYFNQLAFKTLSFNLINSWPLVVTLIGGAVVLGLLAGAYPAFVLSAFRPVVVLKGQYAASRGASTLRRVLVVIQFAISVTLIIGALVANRQLTYMRSADLGFDKEQTLVINTRGNDSISDQREAVREAIESMPFAEGVSYSSSTPGREPFKNVISRDQGMTEDGQTVAQLGVDYDFIDVYEMDIIAGRGFDREMVSDDSAAFVINQAALSALGFDSAEDAIGIELTRQFSDTRRIIGVVRDFHFESLQHAVAPIVLQIRPQWYRYLSVKINSEGAQNSVDRIQAAWSDFSPGRPMDFFFLDADYDQQYRTEVRISSVLNSFTMLAILIACLGLFALASFVTEQRTKEIGVRKVLGASTGTIVMLLAGSFTKLVLLAALLALPAAYFGSEWWLDSFEYRIGSAWGLFAIAVLGAFTIAWLTVGYQSVRAALADPVRSLRSD